MRWNTKGVLFKDRFLAIGTTCTSAQSKSGLIRRIGRGVPNGVCRVVLNAYNICIYVETYIVFMRHG